MSPLELLLIGSVLLAGIGYIFYPNKGLLHKLKRSKSTNQRELIEDALKHIYDCQYNHIDCNVNSIAGNLNISNDKSAKITEILDEMNLVEYDAEKVWLTNEGRTYALKVIRIHRLWEKYLADETSINETEWHTSAEEAEHRLSEEDANRLAAQIGNPVMDPHGDPIPSSAGEIKAKRGIPLTNLEFSQHGKIVHIEDEPQSVYSQIVASGIHNGMKVMLTEKSKSKIKIIAEGEEIVLSPIIASNITVLPETKSEEFYKDIETLASLKKGEVAVVKGISKACHGQQRRRLMDLGIVKGTEIKFGMESPGKDPIAYIVRGSTVALRKSQANQIFISRNGE